MNRRLRAYVVMLVAVGGPLAVTLCGVTCFRHGGNVTANGAQQHGHCSTPQPEGAVFGAPAQTCGHAPDDSQAIQRALQSLTAQDIATVQAYVYPSDGAVAIRPWPVLIDTSPPDLLTLTRQLRV